MRPPCGSLAGGSTRSVDREIDATGYVRSEMVERADSLTLTLTLTRTLTLTVALTLTLTLNMALIPPLTHP